MATSPERSGFSPLAASLHSSFHPDGVSVGLNSDCSSHAWVALSKLICGMSHTVGMSPLPSLQTTEAAIGIQVGALEEPSRTCSSRDSRLADRYSSDANRHTA